MKRPRPEILQIVREWPHCVLLRLSLPLADGTRSIGLYMLVEPKTAAPATLRLRGDHGEALLVDLITQRMQLQRCGLWEPCGTMLAGDVLRLLMHVYDAGFAAGSETMRSVFWQVAA